MSPSLALPTREDFVKTKIQSLHRSRRFHPRMKSKSAGFAVRLRFASEPAPGTEIKGAETASAALEALKKARKDVVELLESPRYDEYSLALSAEPRVEEGEPASTGKTEIMDAKDALESGKTYIVHFTRDYDLSTRKPLGGIKWVAGRFKGEQPPQFTSGESAQVEWQMRRSKSDIHGNVLTLSGDKKSNRGVYTGTKDGQSASYYFFRPQEEGFVAIPCEEWYTFSKSVQRRVFTLEEAEAKMEAGKRAVGEAWGRMDRTVDEPGYSDSDDNRDELHDESSDEEDAFKSKTKKKKGPPGMSGLDSDDEEERGKGAKGTKKKKEEGEDWEHDEEWDDDEDDVAMPEDEEAPKDPTKANDSDAEDEGLDKEGLAVKKLLGKQEKMDAGQFSDSDSDSDLGEDFDPDKDDIAVNVVGSLVERSKKLEAEEKAEVSAKPTASPSASTPASTVGVKRGASAMEDAPPSKAARTAPAAPVVKQSPIEAAIVDIVRKNPDSTTVKLITKTCRKRGLLNSTAGAEELKAAITNLLVLKKLRDGSQILVLK